MAEEISEASRRRAEAAKQYIEQKYKAKENENKERFTRCEDSHAETDDILF